MLGLGSNNSKTLPKGKILSLKLFYLSRIDLVSAGRELIFFSVAGVVLGFGFSVRIMLVTLIF